jgi:predicted metal-dependent phosphoesterase TrpH
MIDLHVHSTFSDGTNTPEELVEMAAKVGITTLSLTDHDGMMGIDRFLAACHDHGIKGVPGVEISVDFAGGTMHMLGYFINHKDDRVETALARMRRGREERNQLILERLNALGLAVAWDDVAKLAKEDVVGRPHFAQVLIEKGYVKKKDEAFDRYLGKGKPAYVERSRLTVEKSISLIREAGGVPVLAHPFTLGLGRKRLRVFLAELADQGLQGIEAYYSEHSHDQQRFCLSVGRDIGLVFSGGSDFHGAMNPHCRLGVGFGTLNVPDDLVELLQARVGGGEGSGFRVQGGS